MLYETAPFPRVRLKENVGLWKHWLLLVKTFFCLGAFPKLASALSAGVILAWLFLINLKLTEIVLSEMKFPLSQSLPIYCGLWQEAEMSVQQWCYLALPSLVAGSEFSKPDSRTWAVPHAMKITQVPGSSLETQSASCCLRSLNLIKRETRSL